MERGRAIAWLACGLLLAAPAPAAPALAEQPAAAGDAVGRARELLRAGDPAAAEALLLPVVAAAPRDGAARMLLGRIALQRGDLAAAREHLEIATGSAPPQLYLAWHLLGRVQLLLGDPAAAGASWSRTLDLAPRFAPALVGRARAALRLEAPSRAAADLERARALPGTATEATLLLAELRLFEGRFDAAAELLRELAGGEAAPAARLLLLAAAGSEEAGLELRRLLPEHLDLAPGLLAYAVARLRAGESAIEPLRAALETDDGDPVAWLFLRRLAGDGEAAAYPAPLPELAARLEAARRRLAEGQGESARTILEAILERRPRHAAARLVLALAAERQGDLWAALAGYRLLLERLPGLAAVEARAARLARSMEAHGLATCLAERALGVLPEDASLHYLLAAVHADAGRHRAAGAACRRAIALGLEEAPVYLTLGLAELESMRVPEAIAAFSKALALDPAGGSALPRLAVASLEPADRAALKALLERRLTAGEADPDTLSDLGALSLRDGDLESARAHFERLVELAPEDSTGWYNLGLIRLRQGDRERGAAAMERFRRLKAAEDERWLVHNRAHALRLEARDAAAGGEAEHALAIYEQLAAAGTADVEDYLAAGRLWMERSEPARGRAWFVEVLAGNPYQPQALAGLAEAAAALGRDGEARLARERANLLSWPCAAP